MKGIELRDAHVHHGPLEALHGVTLAAPTGALTVLLGRNGSGRTTALRALAGTLPLSSGAVLRDGRDITGSPAHERAARGLCFVPDRQAVFSSLTSRRTWNSAAPTAASAAPWPPTPSCARCSPAARAPSRAASNACSPCAAPCSRGPR